MLEEMSSDQLVEWMAFYHLEPWGYASEMMGHGITASRIDNLFLPEGESARQPSEYVPEIGWQDEIDEQRGNDFIEALKEYFARRANEPD
jgi:hypothetical protein